jgi:tRNA pseudouridine32 synthase/23S rRNA pseudouridine746 synthase
VPFFIVKPGESQAVEVLYADDDLIVVDKPAGLLSVPGRGADKQHCVVSTLQAQWPDALVVHRLDMATSGVMVLARGAEAQRTLSRLFAERAVRKCYVAVVAGRPPGATGRIDLPLAADWPRRPLQKVDPVGGKPALTLWRVLGHDAVADTTRLELQPVTGRTHQLRVHLQAIGLPILGDALYAPAEVHGRAARLLLHAHEIELAHPRTGERLIVRSEVPF